MEVKLYVYDLTRGMARVMSQQMLGIQIDAVYHTAIVLENREYFFGAGVQTCRAGTTHHGQPMEMISLGKTELPQDVILEYLQSLKEVYTPESYDLFAHNCNNFSHDFAMFLVGRGIPDHITSLPQRVLDTPFGQMLRPQIDASMRSLTQAPVIDEKPSQIPSSRQDLPLLKLGLAKPVTYNKVPPLDKLIARLGKLVEEPAFAALINFAKSRQQSPINSPLPDMPMVLQAYRKALDNSTTDTEFAIVDLLRYAATDSRVSGYLAEEQPAHATLTHLEDRVMTVGVGKVHKLDLVTIQFLCNCFGNDLFSREMFQHDDAALLSTIDLATKCLSDEDHTTTRVAASWLIFNIADAVLRLSQKGSSSAMSDVSQLDISAAILERLLTESNSEAIKALLLALGRLLYLAPSGGELKLAMNDLEARGTLSACKLERELAGEVMSLL